MKKKSQGLSLEVIIIAAIGLIVLIVLVFIFRGESAKFVKSTNCPAKNGVCLTNMGGEECPEDKPVKIYTNDCHEMESKDEKYIPKEGSKEAGQCCIPIS